MSPKRKDIYTLGTSTRSAEEFLELLKGHGVEVVVDVRRFPTSRWEHFRQAQLAGSLNEAGIEYVYMGEGLGGRRRESYQSYLNTADFQRSLRKLERIALARKTTFICAERFPWRCHRRFIAVALESKSWQVTHIIDRGRDWLPKKAPKDHRQLRFA